jgi:hypothetical protein
LTGNLDQVLQLESTDDSKKKDKCIDLCRLRGLITAEVEEKNELSETKLMAAAAEGRFASLDEQFLAAQYCLVLGTITC